KTPYMPELPEVEVVRRGVQRWATDGEITAVDILDKRSLRRHHSGPENFTAPLIAQHSSAGQRRGRYLWLPCDNGFRAITVHVGVAGQLLTCQPGMPDQKPLKTPITYTTAEGISELRFVDQRLFGALYLDTLVPTQDHPEELIPNTIAHIG